MSTVQELAAEMAAAFEARTRDSGETFLTLKDGSPEWMHEACHEAHGDFMPDDWRYKFIRQAAETLAEDDDPDNAELEADIYNYDLLRWLGSHGARPDYCDQAREDYAMEDATLMQLISAGQLLEREVTLRMLANALQEIADEDDDDES